MSHLLLTLQTSQVLHHYTTSSVQVQGLNTIKQPADTNYSRGDFEATAAVEQVQNPETDIDIPEIRHRTKEVLQLLQKQEN